MNGITHDEYNVVKGTRLRSLATKCQIILASCSYEALIISVVQEDQKFEKNFSIFYFTQDFFSKHSRFMSYDT